MASNTQHTVTGDFFDGIRAAFFTDAAEPADAEPEITAEDVPLSEWADNRAALGLGGHDTGDFVNLGPDQSGLPDWRTPVVEQVEFSAVDEYEEERRHAGVPDLNDFGLPARAQRVNASPWRAV